jgi:hypothetical protein
LLPLGFADEENATEQAKQRCEDAKENPSSQSRACKCRARVVITIGRECPPCFASLCFCFFIANIQNTLRVVFSTIARQFLHPVRAANGESEQGGE